MLTSCHFDNNKVTDIFVPIELQNFFHRKDYVVVRKYNEKLMLTFYFSMEKLLTKKSTI